MFNIKNVLNAFKNDIKEHLTAYVCATEVVDYKKATDTSMSYETSFGTYRL